MDAGQYWSAPTCPHGDTAVAEHGFGHWRVDAYGAELVWLDGRDFDGHPNPAKARMEVRAARWVAGEDWGAEIVLDSSACTCCPLAGTDLPDGRHVVAFRDRTMEEVRDFSLLEWGAFERNDPRRGLWAEATPLAADDWEIAGCPVNGAALVSHGDRLLAVWFTAGGGNPEVKAAWGGTALGFGEPERLNTRSTVGRVAAAVDGDGVFYAVWMQESVSEAVGGGGAGVEIVGRRWSADGLARDDLPVTLVTTSSARASGFPAIEGLAGGGLVLAWTVEKAVETGVWR